MEILRAEASAAAAAAAAVAAASAANADAAEAAQVAGRKAAEEAQEEIALLRQKIGELEEAARVDSTSVEGDGGGGGRSGSGNGDGYSGVRENKKEQRKEKENEDEEKKERGGEGEGEGEQTDALTRLNIVEEERDRLRGELRKAREEAGVRAAALETQLADTEVYLFFTCCFALVSFRAMLLPSISRPPLC